ncbi:hypothetical protein FB45DRAFT_947414 [Roridomyces roridus]|uniref:F-box domain-containing protein n=1 Tax=Roridomyces roridus TaxID=1738132 RepID=A0AAD7B237_9AGAR|nr:hypothetical protein FB45DRAFT_947414 [Roridomyces roridus]
MCGRLHGLTISDSLKASMKDLPDELLDRICAFMDKKELCTTMHISSSLRRIAAPHLLFRLSISQSDMQTGTVKLELSDSLHLIVFVAHICPIQRLECFGNSRKIRASEMQRLSRILGATAPIPDLLIHDKVEFERGERFEWRERGALPKFRTLALHLLANLPQTATDTLLIIPSNSVTVSRPRAGPPPSWAISVPLPRSFSEFLCLTLWAIPLCLVANLCGILWWAIRRVFGYGWSTEERISKDVFFPKAPKLSTRYTLVNHRLRLGSFVIGPLRGVPDSVYSAFLASLGPQYTDVTVQSKSNVIFTDLVALVARQVDLRTLKCSPDSIQPSSLVSASPSQHHISCKIEELIAPASYIPHLLPLTPHVEWLSLSFPSLPSKLPVPAISIRPQAFDHTAYCLALNAIACLPGSHVLTLGFIFDLKATNLPWQMDAESDQDRPETHLHRVEHLVLCAPESKRALYYYTATARLVYTASLVHRALAPWLGSFPNLRGVSFDKGAFEAMSDEQRLAVAEAIVAACPRMRGAGDVVFRN